MWFCCGLNEFEEVAWGSDLVYRERFDGEIAANDQNCKGVEIIRQKPMIIFNLLRSSKRDFSLT